MDRNYLEFTDKDRTVNSSNSLENFHHNTGGLRSKSNEFVIFLQLLNFNPHGEIGPAASHITRLYIRMKFLQSKSVEYRCVYFCF
jgi:hypothetical protein